MIFKGDRPGEKRDGTLNYFFFKFSSKARQKIPYLSLLMTCATVRFIKTLPKSSLQMHGGLNQYSLFLISF